jgi:hypothetical protein
LAQAEPVAQQQHPALVEPETTLYSALLRPLAVGQAAVAVELLLEVTVALVAAVEMAVLEEQEILP